MRIKLYLLLISFTFLVSCSNNAQESKTESGNKDSVNIEHKNLEEIVKKIKSVCDYNDIILEELEDCKGVNEKTVAFIDKRIDQLIGPQMKTWIEAQGFDDYPEYYLFRVFKKEKEIEVWGGKTSGDSLRLIQTFRICAMDFDPGPKARMGDGKTPEGFYRVSELYGSSNWFMWIKLNTNQVDDYGNVGTGSSFKLFVNYPNSLDKLRTSTYLKGNNPGGDICIHGNCVSAGCIAFKNRVFLPVYAFMKKHKRTSYGYPQIHIFPFRFENYSKEEFAENNDDLPSEYLIEFWKNLEEGYKLFNETGKVPKISISNNKYVFSK